MKNAKIALKKPVNFYYLDHAVKNIAAPQGAEILESASAFSKYSWLKKYWRQKPKEGYFIWVKQPLKQPLNTCVAISRLKIHQNLENLLIIEKNIAAECLVSCSALAAGLCAKHQARGTIVLKEGASLSYRHLHSWGKNDYVEPDYSFILEKDAKLAYFYQLLNSPQEIAFKTKVFLQKKASVDFNVIMRGKNALINIEEEIYLLGEESQAVVNLRLAAEKNTRIKAVNRLTAQAKSRGHLECQGMLLDSQSSIELTPSLINKDKRSLLTHEASIGKINEAEINYLRSRGLSPKEAISLIVNGFLRFTS